LTVVNGNANGAVILVGGSYLAGVSKSWVWRARAWMIARAMTAGPVVGLGWASVLIFARAWAWPVPMVPRILFGLALITVIGLLAAATLSRQYRLVCRAAAAACVGTAILDAVMTGTVLVIAPALVWPITVAVVLSAGRSCFALRSVYHALTG
jgi:hypothetical protein